MQLEGINFDARNLAAAIEPLSQYDLDRLPFGVILLDRTCSVIFYSETEGIQSGYAPRSPIGRNFFKESRCFDTDEFRGRIVRAMETGNVDFELGWSGDFNDPTRDMRIRVQSALNGGVWIFIQRDLDKLSIASQRREGPPRPHP
jgi:photoactive yellow protein